MRRFILLLLVALVLPRTVELDRIAAQQPTPPSCADYGPPPVVSPVPGLRPYGVMPTMPAAPQAASRPASWPGGPVPVANNSVAGPSPNLPVSWQQPAPAPAVEPIQAAQRLAQVGSELILVSDLLAALDHRFNEMVEQNGDSVPPEQLEIQRASLIKEVLAAVDAAIAGELSRPALGPEQEQRKAMLEGLLKQQIELKLVYNDAKCKIPAEHFPNVEKQLTKGFEEIEVKKMMKRFGVESYRELDQVLRARGSSFDREKRAFVERNLYLEWMRQEAKIDDEVTFDQIYAYYHQHSAEFDKPAQTRWQELVVPFSNFPSKKEAKDAIIAMGNQVMQGMSFEQVAKAADAGADGSVHDWPDKSRLVSSVVQQAIEGLPVGQPSQILDDWRGFHIVRVVERIPARHVPFKETQREITEKIKTKRTETQRQAYLGRLNRQYPVSTVLDGK